MADATFRAALIQICSSRSLDENVAIVGEMVRRAVAQGAEYVQTPEVTTLIETKREDLFANTPAESENAPLRDFSDLAAELGIWLHIGSMGVRVSPDKIANRSFLISPDGRAVASYDKIHMFDVDLGEGQQYRESKNYRPGDRAVTAELPWGRLGLTICYDMRFPHLYEQLAQAGCDFIAIPSSFTVPTGRAHWETILRGRAIETQSFVFAAAQAGDHACGRSTYGHSMIVSPWGEVLAEAGESAPEIVFADIDVAEIAAARRKIPALSNRRGFAPPATMPSVPADRDATNQTEDAA